MRINHGGPFGAVVVHRFDMGMTVCRCGGMVVTKPERKSTYNQMGWPKGKKRGPRKKRREESDDADRYGEE